MNSGVTAIGQGWTKSKGLRGQWGLTEVKQFAFTQPANSDKLLELSDSDLEFAASKLQEQ